MSAILVIEDDEGTRDWFTTILGRDGFAVTTAEGGREGLRLATNVTFDLIFADLRLPDVSGIEILHEMKAVHATSPVIIMTAWGSVSTAVRAIQLGAIDYIEKPLGENLAEIVRHALEAARWIDHDTTARQTVPIQDRHRTEKYSDVRVEKTLRTMEVRSHEADLNLTVVARLAGLSTAHLCRLLKQQTGRGFGAHLRGIRIRRARELLRNTTLNIKEIATRVGYESTTQLDRHFGRSCNMPPLAYRHSVWRANAPHQTGREQF